MTSNNCDELLNYAICEIFQIPNFYIKENIIKSFKIDNVFGLFTTIKRSQYQKLKSFPEDVHGCIGKYDLSFKNLSNKDLFDYTISTAKSAVFEDNRKTYFNSILLDSESIIEVSFMKNPLYNINPVNGLIIEEKVIFNNNKYGIIVMNKNETKTATFLPEVFDEKTKWENLRANLMVKANIVESEEVLFKAYTIEKHKKKLIDILQPNYINTIFDKIGSFFNNYYKEKIPYSIEKNNKEQYIITFNNDDIRNIATLKDLTDMNNTTKVLNNDVLTQINKDIEEYDKKFNEENAMIRQASTFLSLITQNKDNSKKICTELVNSIKDIDDKSFELGQALIALIKCNEKNIVEDNLKLMYADFIKKDSYDPNDLFRINWQLKALLIYINDYNGSINESMKTHIDKHLKFLISTLLDILNNGTLSTYETNYLAVCFECMSLYYKDNKNNNKLNNKLFQIFILLQQRFSIFGLYMFTVGKSKNNARVDITGHCIQGLIQYYL